MSDQLKEQYCERYNEMNKFISCVEEYISTSVCDAGVKIDRIGVRVKDADSFIKKALKESDGKLKYQHPFEEIQDQIGARIVVYFIDDLEVIANNIKQYFSIIEEKRFPPESYKEFSYEGRHFIIDLSDDLIPQDFNRDLLPGFFELQIKTLFQHAWAQAEHDVGYKQERSLSFEEKRLLAFAAAQAWGADKIFQQILNAK
jgi:ppGpp synthetase/RelA/SpoT-type nucleotidyltranferase